MAPQPRRPGHGPRAGDARGRPGHGSAGKAPRERRWNRSMPTAYTCSAWACPQCWSWWGSPNRERVEHYRVLRDGMNLVAKEYIDCRHDESCALVLSVFTGAADELGSAFRPKLEQPTREACPTR